MRIQSLKAAPEPTPPSPVIANPGAVADPGAVTHANGEAGPAASMAGEAGGVGERQALEVALLNARIQHLELVVETARSLMGSNQERLLRRLHDVPRDIAMISAQLRRIDPQSAG